ncbi:MAG: hypothetical protein HY514_01480 [Candidatus Aenigmarchaeota archaeon]|nr:hypothetical protein [Candidatus Aenigmarchaeota archaeon]
MKKLERIADGLYVSDATRALPFRLAEDVFANYYMPLRPGSFETNYIGTILVEAARKEGQWVGMSIEKLTSQMAEEFVAFGKGTQYEAPTQPLPEEETERRAQRASRLSSHMLDPKTATSQILEMQSNGYLDIVEQGRQLVFLPTREFVGAVYNFVPGSKSGYN